MMIYHSQYTYTYININIYIENIGEILEYILFNTIIVYNDR